MTIATTVRVAAGRTLTPELQQALSGVAEVSSLPEVTTKIMQIVEDPKATAHNMHEIIRTDPALAAKILRVVNSAFYGLPSRIASLERAILLLGLSAVKNIALAASLARLFNVEALSEQPTARDLWRHSIAVGSCARLLADSGKCWSADEAFVAGLVHDLGLIALQQLYPVKLHEIIARGPDEGQTFCALEESVLGADHQLFGGALAVRWRFPPVLRYAIGCHHEPHVLEDEQRKIVTLVYVADTLCCRGQFGLCRTGCGQEIPDWMLALTGWTSADLDRVLDELPPRVEEAEQLFMA